MLYKYFHFLVSIFKPRFHFSVLLWHWVDFSGSYVCLSFQQRVAVIGRNPSCVDALQQIFPSPFFVNFVNRLWILTWSGQKFFNIGNTIKCKAERSCVRYTLVESDDIHSIGYMVLPLQKIIEYLSLSVCVWMLEWLTASILNQGVIVFRVLSS